jgi:mxaJ protein
LAAPPAKPLRVCADPNNLPFSNQQGLGFENALAEMLGATLKRPVEYTWWAQRRGAIRSTLKAGLCDVVMGVPTSLQVLEVTVPYYRSSYVFVTRADAVTISSFDDPRLRYWAIGVQLVGDDYHNTPPVHALSARGISDNVRGYSVLGDYAEPLPAARILEAVERREVDVAIVWGPLAGYFALHHPGLRLTPTPADDGPLPMRFEIGMGVRRADHQLRQELDSFIVQQRPRIDQLLVRYGVPRP